MIDYDEIDQWEPHLSEALAAIVPNDVRASVAARVPEYIEDAKTYLFQLAPQDDIITITLQWIEANTIAAYHGSRLTSEEQASIRTVGLLPMVATARRERIARALCKHPNWTSAKARLDTEIQAHGPGNKAGRREGQVHLTLSRAGLVKGFNHYLVHGSEFDQHVAYALLGQDGQELLATDGVPTLIKVELPGAKALAGAHPHIGVEDTRRRGEVPNLVNDFLKAWSYRLYAPNYQTRTGNTDCGIWFREAVPASRIRSVVPCIPAM